MIDASSSIAPLDSTKVFGGDYYNYYNVKRKGHYAKSRPFPIPIKKEFKTISTRRFDSVVRAKNPEKKQALNIIKRTIYSSRLDQGTKSKKSILPKIASNTSELEKKLFNEIKDYDQDLQRDQIRINPRLKFKKYSSDGINGQVRWGLPNKKVTLFR